MYVQAATPLSIGGVLDDAIRLYRASFRHCWAISLVGSIANAAMSIWIMSQMAGFSTSLASGFFSGLMPDLKSIIPRMMGSYVGMGKFYLAEMLVSLLVFAALFTQVSVIHRGSSALSLGDALSGSLRRLPGMIGGAIIFTVAVGIGATFGAILLFVPGIYLWGKLELWIAAMFEDDTGVIDGIGRSWNTTVGNWWRSVTIISIALIIIWVVEIGVSLLSIALAGGPMVFMHPDTRTLLFLIPQVVNALVGAIIRPMYPIVLLTTYHDMKLRREGGDLAVRANSLQSA